MATYYYGVTPGDEEYEVAVGTSTTSKVIELAVTDAVTKRGQIIQALDEIRNTILRLTYPPA